MCYEAAYVLGDALAVELSISELCISLYYSSA